MDDQEENIEDSQIINQGSFFDKSKEFIFGIAVVCISLVMGVFVMNLFDRSGASKSPIQQEQLTPTSVITQQVSPDVIEDISIYPSQETMVSPTSTVKKNQFYISQKYSFQIQHPSLNINPCISVPYGMSDGYVTDVVLAKGEPEHSESCGLYSITIGMYPQAKESDIDEMVNKYFQMFNKDDYVILEEMINKNKARAISLKNNPDSKLYLFSRDEDGPVYVIEIEGISNKQHLQEIEELLSTFEFI